MAGSSTGNLNWSLQERNITCNECHENIFRTGDICRDRADHYVRYTYAVHSCPVCLLILPTTCAIAAHLRLHLKIPPYICPQCGQTLPESIMSYPFEHYCEGFNKMRANVRYNCKLENCNNLVHPKEFTLHYKTHLIKVFQCTICSTIWSKDAQTRCQHYNDKIIMSIGYRCPLCPNNLFAENNIEEHVELHYDDLCKQWNVEIHPCRICNIIHRDIESLLHHHIVKHNAFNIKNILAKVLVMRNSGNPNNTDNFWLIKNCNKCLKSYTYQSNSKNMNILENICPYGCLGNKESLIQCFICKMKITQKWEDIKSHYAQYHNEHKCLDLKLELTKHDMSLYYNKTTNIQNVTGNIQNYSEEAYTSQVNYGSVQISDIPSLSGMVMQVFSPDDDLSVVEIDVASEETDESMQAAHNSNVCCEMEIETRESCDDTDEETDLIIIEDNNESVEMEQMEIQVTSDDNDLTVVESHVSSGENNEILQTPESSNQREVKSHEEPTKKDSLFSLQDNIESVSTSENPNVYQEQNDLQVNNVDEDTTVGGSKASIEQNIEVGQTEENPNVYLENKDLQVNNVDKDPTVGGTKASIEQNIEVGQTEENPNVYQENKDLQVNNVDKDPTVGGSKDSMVQNNDVGQTEENPNVYQENKDLQVNNVDKDPTVGGSKDSMVQNNDVGQAEENPNKCKICNRVCHNKANLEKHFITHRDSKRAYQCLECGECFSARASFAIHLFIAHEIRKVQDYIETKPCYNERVQAKTLYTSFFPPDEVVKENQCQVCKIQLENSVDLGRHIRVHGLPYILSLKRKRQVDRDLYRY